MIQANNDREMCCVCNSDNDLSFINQALIRNEISSRNISLGFRLREIAITPMKVRFINRTEFLSPSLPILSKDIKIDFSFYPVQLNHPVYYTNPDNLFSPQLKDFSEIDDTETEMALKKIFFDSLQEFNFDELFVSHILSTGRNLAIICLQFVRETLDLGKSAKEHFGIVEQSNTMSGINFV